MVAACMQSNRKKPATARHAMHLNAQAANMKECTQQILLRCCGVPTLLASSVEAETGPHDSSLMKESDSNKQKTANTGQSSLQPANS